MSDSGKDRWNSLLETLGVPASETVPRPPAETPAEESTSAPAKQQPISMLRPEKKAASKPKPAKPAPKSPSYWSRIAGVLGLESATASEPAPEPTEQLAQEAPVAESPEPSFTRHDETRRSRSARDEESPRGFERARREDLRREEPRREEPRREEPRREERRPRQEHQGEKHHREEREEAAESSRQSLTEMFGKKEPDVNVFGLGIRDEDGETRTDLPEEPFRAPEDSGAVLDYDRPEGSDLAFQQPAAAERGFGEEEGDERDGRRRRRRRGRGRGRSRGGEQPAHAAERHESDIEPAGEDADFDIDRDEELDLDVELSDRPVSQERGPRGGEKPRDLGADEFAPRGERPPRRRSERGDSDRDEDRRGGRSRRGERGESGRRERDESRPPRGPRHAARSQADDEPDEDLHAATVDDDDSGDSGSPTHKKIPTWEEAVNLLIDANMTARANSPDRGDRGRGRGRGRGR